MATLLEIKEHLKSFYSRFEAYIVPVLKFIAAMAALLMVNRELGFMSQLNSFAVVLIVALLCSFLPLNFIIVAAALFALGHVYKLSLECAAGVLVLFLLMFLLYFRFSPKDTIVVVLTPICFALKVPTVMPLVMGLAGGPASMISVGCGVVVYYVITFVGNNASIINSLDADGSLARLRYLIDGIMGNKAMLVTVAAFAVTILLVYIIRRLPVDHCWTYAMIAGALMNIVILMLGDLKFRTNISILGTILSSVVAVGIAKVLQFFVFNVDYSRTEHIQYEDDEYYYYVKAVPKMSVALSDKTITKIDTKKPGSGQKTTHASEKTAIENRSTVSARNRSSVTGSTSQTGRSSVTGSASQTNRSSVTGSASQTGRSSVTGSASQTGRSSVTGSTSQTGRSSVTASTSQTGRSSVTRTTATGYGGGTATSRSTSATRQSTTNGIDRLHEYRDK